MRKKSLLFIVPALILLAVLFIPVSKGPYRDGGTREYVSLTYKIVSWRRLTDDSLYEKTRVYFGSDRNKTLDELWEMEKPETPSLGPVNEPDSLPFSARYIRTGLKKKEASFPEVAVICSAENLREYYESNREKYDLERRENPASDSSVGFLDACDAYDDAFFEKNALVLVVLEEGSGSTRHRVKEVRADERGVLYLDILSVDSKVGTCDMAWWHIITEIPAAQAPKSKEYVTVSYCNEKMDREHIHVPCDQPQTVSEPFAVYCGNTMTTVHFPSGEKYSFMLGNSVSLTDLLLHLKYDPEKTCNCLSEYTVDTEFELGYEISLSQSFVRCGSGQADLTYEQTETVKEILSWAKKEMEKK